MPGHYLGTELDPNLYKVSVNEILPGIWVGNEAASQSAEFMRKANISMIVNATTHIPSKFLGSIYYIRVPALDSPDYNGLMAECLRVVCPIILRARNHGMNVLIHCHAGMQRSAIIAAAFILYSRPDLAITAADACIRVREKRNLAFAYGKHVNFARALEDYWAHLRAEIRRVD